MRSEKTAIIIAAGSGMGAATARKLAADGYHVGPLSQNSCRLDRNRMDRGEDSRGNKWLDTDKPSKIA